MIRLNCFFRAKDESSYKTALDAAKTLVASSVKEDGCVAYDVFESATRPGVFLICETWRDDAALDAHSSTDVFKTNVGAITASGEMSIERFVK